MDFKVPLFKGGYFIEKHMNIFTLTFPVYEQFGWILQIKDSANKTKIERE